MLSVMKGPTVRDWPGNIRELENFVERAVILTRGKSLEAPLAELRKSKIDAPAQASSPAAEQEVMRILNETIESLRSRSAKGKARTAENEHAKRQHEEIVHVLTECKGKVGGAGGAATRMGLSRTTLLARMKKLGISRFNYA
jgi:formate hydrogenlyase transcriptional activator